MQDNMLKMPSAIEAERNIIGCLLLYPEIADTVFSVLSANDFYFKDNKAIITAIETISSRKDGIIDQSTVTEELSRTGKLEEAGGLDNIYNIINDVPSLANHEAYIQLIHEKAVARRLFNVVDSIRGNILENKIPFEDLMIQSEAKFNEIIKNQSKEDFKRVDQLSDSIIELIEENKSRDEKLVGLDTGYPDLNKMTSGFKKNELLILAARPSVGKSTWALNLACNICEHKHGVAYFSLEMGYDQLLMRMLSTYSGVDLNRIVSGDLTDEDMALILQAKNRIDKMHLYIDQSSSSNLRDIKVKCQKLYNEGNLDMIVIDYLQLLSSGQGKANRVEEVSVISRGLKEMARSFGIPVIALSQLSRGIETREDKTPVLADLRESGSIEQDADIVMFLHREAPKKVDGTEDMTKYVKSTTTKVIIAKNRQGLTGDFDLTFKGSTSCFITKESK